MHEHLQVVIQISVVDLGVEHREDEEGHPANAEHEDHQERGQRDVDVALLDGQLVWWNAAALLLSLIHISQGIVR